MSGGVRVHLYDADGQDRQVSLDDVDSGSICERCLLWVDVDLDAGGSVEPVADRMGLEPREREHIETETGQARLFRHAGRVHLTLEAIEPSDEGRPGEEPSLVRREIDLVASPGMVLSVHRGRVAALERFAEGFTGETTLGALEAADLLSSLADEVISGYLEVAERIERRIDRLDELALDGRAGEDVLRAIVSTRKQIGFVRRTLAPHRGALAALARPDMPDAEGVGQPWPGLVERLEGAMNTIEALRDALLGTYDIHMGTSAQRANDVMKVLTVVSAIFLPAVVLAGVLGMNFELDFYDEPTVFFLVVGVMVVFGVVLVIFARLRGWL